MICLTKLSGDTFYLNPHLIETMEQKPDNLVIMLTTGKIFIVKERFEKVREKLIEYDSIVDRARLPWLPDHQK